MKQRRNRDERETRAKTEKEQRKNREKTTKRGAFGRRELDEN
jgi:hypothetical protein